jgi:hypothetical protein
MVRERCAEVPVDVAAATDDERRLACSAALAALERFGRCGIALQRPLRIRIGPEIPHAPGREAIGLFDAVNQTLYMREIESTASLIGGTPFGEIPRREFFKSAIVHEIVHAVVHQNTGSREVSAPVHEYLAYALQIESLASGARAQFLQAVGERQGAKEQVFSEVFLGMNPFLFAAYAFEHFEAATDRCARLVALLEGEPDFVATSWPY